jgi:Tfp pilus assembly protein PilO
MADQPQAPPAQPQNQPQDQNFDQMIADAATEMTQGSAPPETKKGLQLGALGDTLLNYIVPLVALVLSGLIGVFILVPSYKNLPELEAQLNSKKKLKHDLTMKLENINRLSDFKNVVDENSQLVDRALVSQELVPGLLTQIDKIARDSGFKLSRLNYGLGTTTQTGVSGDAVTYDFVTVNLGVNGSFEQLKTFLRNLENSARIINVDKFRYSLSESEEGESLGVTFVLMSPYLYVESEAVIDEPIDLDISNPDFISLINKIKNLRYYDPYEVNLSVPVVETKEDEAEEEETTEETAEDRAVTGGLRGE